MVIFLGTLGAILGGLATLGLYYYARKQTQLQERAEQARLRERKEDDDRAVDLARDAVNAEYLRLWTLARQWQEADLVQWAADGRLDANDVLPADWAMLTTNLARLGPSAAALANMALVSVRDIALVIRKLQSELRSGRNHEAARYAETVRENTMEAALLLEDAMAHCPRTHAQWPFDTNIPMKSKAGQLVAAEQRRRAEASAQSAVPLPAEPDDTDVRKSSRGRVSTFLSRLRLRRRPTDSRGRAPNRPP